MYYSPGVGAYSSMGLEEENDYSTEYVKPSPFNCSMMRGHVDRCAKSSLPCGFFFSVIYVIPTSRCKWHSFLKSSVCRSLSLLSLPSRSAVISVIQQKVLYIDVLGASSCSVSAVLHHSLCCVSALTPPSSFSCWESDPDLHTSRLVLLTPAL